MKDWLVELDLLQEKMQCSATELARQVGVGRAALENMRKNGKTIPFQVKLSIADKMGYDFDRELIVAMLDPEAQLKIEEIERRRIEERIALSDAKKRDKLLKNDGRNKEILAKAMSGMKLSEVARHFGLSSQTTSHVVMGRLRMRIFPLMDKYDLHTINELHKAVKEYMFEVEQDPGQVAIEIEYFAKLIKRRKSGYNHERCVAMVQAILAGEVPEGEPSEIYFMNDVFIDLFSFRRTEMARRVQIGDSTVWRRKQTIFIRAGVDVVAAKNLLSCWANRYGGRDSSAVVRGFRLAPEASCSQER